MHVTCYLVHSLRESQYNMEYNIFVLNLCKLALKSYALFSKANVLMYNVVYAMFEHLRACELIVMFLAAQPTIVSL